MVANLSMINGEAEMMYTGERPWHGLGVALDKPATAEEAIAAAHLGWLVETAPVAAKIGDTIVDCPGAKATYRADNNSILGVVGDRYTPVQNTEAFQFFDGVVGEGAAIYHTAGALRGGALVWILAKLPGEIRIKKTDDITEKFLLLCNSHNATTRLIMCFTPIRVVCQNTLIAGLGVGEDKVAILHTASVHEKAENAARRLIEKTTKYYETFEEQANFLAENDFLSKEVDEYLDTMFPSDETTGEYSGRTKNTRDKIKELLESSTNSMEGIKGSYWSLYNSVAEWVDHHRTSRGQIEDPSIRLQSIWLGSSAALKNKAFKQALVLANS